MYKLVICDDEGKMTVVPLVRDEITIGRKEGNTIRLTERNVSRRHARLRRGNGSIFVQDLESFNGVRVNGKRIDKEVVVKGGDQISIGDYVLAVHVDDAAGADGGGDGTSGPRGGGDTTVDRAFSAGAPTAILASPPPSTGPPARLVMLSPPAPGAEFALSRAHLRIGRAEDLDVWINHRSISREHAEVLREGSMFRIRDLASANGIRVNGKDVAEAVFRSGDVVELGQVRFRFVAAGETYVFDADHTTQMEAIRFDGPSRAPLVAAIGVVLVAVTVAAIVAFVGAGPRGTEDGVGDVGQLSPALASDQSSAIELRQRCESALAAGDADEALTHAREALAVSPNDSAAAACKRKAELRAQEDVAFADGTRALRAGNPAAAVESFALLAPTSDLRGRSEVAEATRRHGDARLTEARASLGGAPEDTLAVVEEVLALPGLPADVVEAATRLQAEARAAIARRDAPREPEPAPRPPRASRVATAPAATATTPTPTASSAWEDARGCAAAGNHRCVVQALEGRTGSARELALLIETYRQMGNRPAQMRNMELFVRRYPTDAKAQSYRQILSRYGP